jgi:hypothetical protein
LRRISLTCRISRFWRPQGLPPVSHPGRHAGSHAAIRIDGAEAMIVTDPTRIARVLGLILTANAAQVADPAFAAELKSWLRLNARAAVETGDGHLLLGHHADLRQRIAGFPADIPASP